MSHLPLWFADAPPYELDAPVDHRRRRRRERTESGLWVLDEALVAVPDEPVECLIGSAPSWALGRLDDAGIAMPHSLVELGPARNAPTSEIAALGSVCLVTFDGSPAVGVWWRRDGYTLFGTWWDGWFVSGLRPTDGDHAVRLEETLG